VLWSIVNMLDDVRDKYCWEDMVKLSLSPVIFAFIFIVCERMKPPVRIMIPLH